MAKYTWMACISFVEVETRAAISPKMVPCSARMMTATESQVLVFSTLLRIEPLPLDQNRLTGLKG